MNGKRAFELLEKIGFVRVSGSKEEVLAAKMLLEEVKAIGVEGEIDSFQVVDAVNTEVSFEVLEPYHKEYEVKAYTRCGNTSDEGLITEFLYVEDGEELNLRDAKGKFILVNGNLRIPKYKQLMDAEVAGYMTMSGELLDENDKRDLGARKLGNLQLQMGRVPAVNIRLANALELVKEKASKIKLVVKETNDKEMTSQNVYAEIKGTSKPEEIIVFGAHYDSVPFSKGVYDNGSGSVILMELLRYFKANPPQRTLRFHWYGSEEVGLEGSWHYVNTTSDLDKHLLMINVDVAGAVLGMDKAIVSADKKLVDDIKIFSKELCFPINVVHDIYSSDSIPFVDKGIPGLNFCRFGTKGSAYIHDRYDDLNFLSPDSLERTAKFISLLAEKLINSEGFPITKDIPISLRTKVDEYLGK